MCASQPRVVSTMAVPFEAQRELKPAESMCLMSDKRSELYRNQTFRKLLYTCHGPAKLPERCIDVIGTYQILNHLTLPPSLFTALPLKVNFKPVHRPVS